MNDALPNRVWGRVKGWFAQHADHLAVEFFPVAGHEPIHAHGGYVRLWLVEGFLADRKTWGNTHFPALHGGLALRFLGGESTPFTTFARPSASWEAPGAQLDFPVTALLPFYGGTVEVEAALYQASVAGPLATATQLIGALSSLIGPPLAAAAAIAQKVSDGLDAVLAATGDQPVLGVHWAMTSAGGVGQQLRSGYLAVVNAPSHQLKGALTIRDGRLAIDDGGGPAALTGVDFLVLRVECRTERDDWRLPHLDELIRRAGVAYIEGHQDEFAARRTEAIAQAWNSQDLIPADRKRVAKLVAQEIDGAAELGAVPGAARTLEVVAPQRLASPDAPDLATLRLEDLLAGGPAL